MSIEYVQNRRIDILLDSKNEADKKAADLFKAWTTRQGVTINQVINANMLSKTISKQIEDIALNNQ